MNSDEPEWKWKLFCRSAPVLGRPVTEGSVEDIKKVQLIESGNVCATGATDGRARSDRRASTLAQCRLPDFLQEALTFYRH
jgi:hypothetical protein